MNRGDFKKIAEKTLISYKELSHWKRKIMINPDFNPLIRHYSENLRIFDPTEEKAIADYIIENNIKPGYKFTDEDFKDIAYMDYLSGRKIHTRQNILPHV